MPVYFAAARSVAASPVARVLAKRAVPQAANDETGDAASEATLRVALLHFAKHGLASAEAAQAQARRAYALGDTAAGREWAAICAAFDRRLASEITGGDALPG
jgi:hypothetical protein